VSKLLVVCECAEEPSDSGRVWQTAEGGEEVGAEDNP